MINIEYAALELHTLLIFKFMLKHVKYFNTVQFIIRAWGNETNSLLLTF